MQIIKSTIMLIINLPSAISTEISEYLRFVSIDRIPAQCARNVKMARASYI